MPDRRLYAQLTLDYADSHKIAPLSDAAFRTHVSMILWSRRYLTDGRIPAAMALVLAGRRPKVLLELTTNDPEQPSLIRDSEGDYWLHDFLEHNTSRAAVEAKQETNRANGARGGRAKAKRLASDSLTESEANLYTETETETKTPLTTFEGGASAAPPPVENPGDRPAPHCPQHPGGTDRPCRACGDARRAHDDWTPPAPPPRAPRWNPATHCEHGQHRDTCEACEYEARRASTVIAGPWGAA